MLKPIEIHSSDVVTLRLPTINNSITNMLMTKRLIVNTEFKLNLQLAKKIHDRISVNYPNNLDSLELAVRNLLNVYLMNNNSLTKPQYIPIGDVQQTF